MKQLVISFVFLLMVSSIARAQSNGLVEFQELGVSFRVPSGWTGGIKDDFYLLGHSSIPGLMILSENKSKTSKELKNLAMQGIQEEGIQLSPKDDFKLKGNNQVEGFYEGTFNGQFVRVYSIGLINRLGSGMNISIVTEKTKFTDKHIQEVRKLAKSVRFFRQKDSKETKFWKQRIVGKKLRYMKTRTSNSHGSFTGTSDSETIKLYPDGTFYYYSSSTTSQSGTGTSGMFVNRDANKGEFKIYTAENQTHLDLYFPDKTLTYNLSRNGLNHTLLNGNRFSVLGLD